jgi:succinate-semialdehyde dehydrogenase/glutarate-semialdehyde dehydrogenase
MSIQTINPTTNKVLKSFEEMTEKAVTEAVTQASDAFDQWKKHLTNTGRRYCIK